LKQNWGIKCFLIEQRTHQITKGAFLADVESFLVLHEDGLSFEVFGAVVAEEATL